MFFDSTAICCIFIKCFKYNTHYYSNIVSVGACLLKATYSRISCSSTFSCIALLVVSIKPIKSHKRLIKLEVNSPLSPFSVCVVYIMFKGIHPKSLDRLSRTPSYPYECLSMLHTKKVNHLVENKWRQLC